MQCFHFPKQVLLVTLYATYSVILERYIHRITRYLMPIYTNIHENVTGF